ncbi:MAG: 3-methyl-2-oxobutanoate hydroxymethyltransferase [Nitrospirota bacterium]
MAPARVTVPELQRRKADGERITMVTAYDYPFARIADEAGIDVVLVGDSVGVVVQGHSTTLPVTMDQMIYHTEMVTRGARRALVIGDMPFMSFQVSDEEAVRNAGRFIQEGRAAAVKLESPPSMMSRVAAIAAADIPVMAHLGLSPQSIHKMGGYKVQGRTPPAAQRLLDDAKRAEDAGAFAVLIEGVPPPVAKRITKALAIPTIGIGAGPGCDGQVLVLHDLLGLFVEFSPKFVKRYANLRETAIKALTAYRNEVMTGRFPSEKESY